MSAATLSPRHYPLTLSLIGLVWSVYFLGLATPSIHGIPATDLILGFDLDRIRIEREYWRLFTPSVIHSEMPFASIRGLGHIIVNSIGLVFCVGWLEKVAGTTRCGLVVLIGLLVSFWPLVHLSTLFDDRYFGGSSGVIWCAATVGTICSVKHQRISPPAAYLCWAICLNLWRLLSQGVSKAILVHSFGLIAGLLACLALHLLSDSPAGSRTHRRRKENQ